MLVALVLIGVVVLLLLWLSSPPARLKRLGDQLPGPKPYPLVGNALTFHITGLKAFGDLLDARVRYGGAVVRVWLGPQLHVITWLPEDIQMLLSSNTLLTKSGVYDNLHSWLGSGLLVSTGELWQRRRKAITPTFHFKILDHFVPLFNKCGATLVSCLRTKVGEGSFDICPYLSNCALDAISESAMGIQVEAQTKPYSEYVVSVLEMTKLLAKKISYPWLGLEPLFSLWGVKREEQKRLDILHSLPLKVLREKRTELEESKAAAQAENDLGIKEKKAFLELLLNIKNENSLTFRNDQDLMDEVCTFMFEGHDTTTASLSFTTYLLGKHPEIQENVYKEVSPILQQNENLKMEHLQDMKYLERVIKESIRLYPPVPVFGRHLEKDITLPSGYLVPAGSDIYVAVTVAHRNPDFFPEPEKFDPDRFLLEQKHPYAYIPFSAGPRNCIGQKFAMLELKALIARLVYNYKITTKKEVQVDHEIILRPEGGVHVTLTERKSDSQAI